MFEDSSPGVPRPTFCFGYNMLTAKHLDRPTFVFGTNFLTNETAVFSPQVPTAESQSSATTTPEGDLNLGAAVHRKTKKKSVCASDVANPGGKGPGSHECKTYNER